MVVVLTDKRLAWLLGYSRRTAPLLSMWLRESESTGAVELSSELIIFGKD